MLTVQSACARELSSVRLKNVDSAHNTNDSGWFIVPWFDAGFSSQNESAYYPQIFPFVYYHYLSKVNISFDIGIANLKTKFNCSNIPVQ